MEDVCGALLGACMMLGFNYGRTREDLDTASTDRLNNCYQQVGMLYKWFEKEFGAVKCHDLRTRFAGVFYRFDVPWQAELAREAGIPEKCTELTAKTTAKTLEMLLDGTEPPKPQVCSDPG